MSFISEFKQFAMKGNVVDMAVGVIIGGAFGKIVTSIVSDIIMPPIGWLIGGVDFTDLKITLPANLAGETVAINYGSFLQTVIDFLIITFCIFLLIKVINKLTRKKEEVPTTNEPPTPTKEELLLTEIRDLLRERKNN